MTQIVETLRTLHRIHRQLADLRERLEKGPRQLLARAANITRLEAEVEETTSKSKATRMLVDQKELQLKTGEAKILELKGKLNTAASNREYQALLEQIAGNEMANSVLSDEILELFERVDGSKEIVSEAAQRLDQAKAELEKTRAVVEEEQQRIKADIERLDGELEDTEKLLPADVLEMYLRTTASKGHDAMAQADRETCRGCFQHITPNRYNDLFLGHVVLCQTCGRLLYLPEDSISPV
jgi:predicted  nucleic acid-binding Zn-ribbon protein